MQMQPYYNSYNAPIYALYPCESHQDPYSEWVVVQNQQRCAHVAECQQYNGQNYCSYKSTRNNFDIQAQPMIYIQRADDCQTQRCESACLRGRCEKTFVVVSCGYGELCGQFRTTTTAPPSTTTSTVRPSTTTTTVRPSTRTTTRPPSTRITTRPPSTRTTTRPPSTRTKTTPPSTRTKTTPPSTRTTTTPPSTRTTTTPPPTTSSTFEPPKFDTTIIPVPPPVECENEYGCVPVPQQQIYHQPSSSSSAAAAAAASSGGSSASASASAAGGSSSASASASSSSQFVLYPGVSFQQYQPTPCSGSQPCDTNHKGTIHVSDGDVTIEGNQGYYFVTKNQSPCEQDPCKN
ncbi:hypothetical protein PV327_008473 [Microctonus hyperodae]|uniref:Uncharacterized protein n=1 Tax=Microctonus hyperodae TaxID=165561 RepID=A0AA39F387_MICHY|nr:hypothetical protein PV327_008473 [Microctonus hyperodae]